MIIQKKEKVRGCGYRKPGGMYLVSDGIGSPCCKLPLELTVCPCCNAGIKQARGFTWVSTSLFAGPCTGAKPLLCPMSIQDTKVGLMWVGEKFYPTPEDFTNEAAEMGVSKRIAQIPNDFVVGKTWIYLAHPKAVVKTELKKVGRKQMVRRTLVPGIFKAFKPSRIEYIVTGKESAAQIKKLEKRGFTCIQVIPQ